MKSIMQSDYVLPKKGFFSNYDYSHTLVQPTVPEKQPKRYNPHQYPAETIAWSKPNTDHFETTYRSVYKSPTSEKITNRAHDKEFIQDRHLSQSLVPKRFPPETYKKNCSHHVSGIYARDFREEFRPDRKQFTKVKYSDNMANTTLAATTARTRELSSSPLSVRNQNNAGKNASGILRAIYINRSEVGEHIRENHDDLYYYNSNKANREQFASELHEYDKVYRDRAGHSPIAKRFTTVEPRKKQERKDVANTHMIKKLVQNSFMHEKDYNQVDRDFKYAYVAPCHTRHPVTNNYYLTDQEERMRSISRGRANEAASYYSRSVSRSRTPELGSDNRGRQKTDRNRGSSLSTTPIKSFRGKSTMSTTPRTPTKRESRKSQGPISVNKLIKKYT